MLLESINSNNLKVIFDTNKENLLIGDLVKVLNKDKTGVLAQVSGIDCQNSVQNLAHMKILCSITQQAEIIEWIGNVPSKESFLQKLSIEELLLCMNAQKSSNVLSLGALSLYGNASAIIEQKNLFKSSLMLCDKQLQRTEIMESFAVGISNLGFKSLLLDFRGEYSHLQDAVIIKAGTEFKLPLNSKGIETLYKNTLANVSIETLAVIEDIFMEVQNFADSSESGYIPFSSFKSVVDTEYEENGLAELIVLKNRLAKLEKQGIFADTAKEIKFLEKAINDNNLVILDLSGIDVIWHKEFIDYLIDLNVENNFKYVLFIEGKESNFSFDLIDKMFVKGYKSGIIPFISLGYNSKFVNTLMSVCKNYIFCPPKLNTEPFPVFRSFISRLNLNEILAFGDITSQLPLFINISRSFQEQIPQNIALNSQQIPNPENIKGIVEDYVYHVNNENMKTQVPEESQLSYSELNEEDFKVESLNFSEFLVEPEQVQKESEEEIQEDVVDEPDAEDLEFYQENLQKFAVDNYNEQQAQIEQPEELVSQNQNMFSGNEQEFTPSNQLQTEEESFSESSLEVDPYVFEFTEEELETNAVYDQSEEDESQFQQLDDNDNDIPIYSATTEDEGFVDEPDFSEGDRVFNQKYGQGYIKKIMGYGNKYIFSIQFDNISGKRLLDPELAKIEKI